MISLFRQLHAILEKKEALQPLPNLLGKLLKPIFSRGIFDFWFAFPKCPIRKCLSDSLVWFVKCLALQLKPVGCRTCRILNVRRSATQQILQKLIEGILILAFKISE